VSVVATACNYAANRNREKAFWMFSISLDLLGALCGDRIRCKIAFSVRLSQCEMEEASVTKVL